MEVLDKIENIGITILVFITFINSFFLPLKRNIKNKLLFSIIGICSVLEATSIILKINGFRIGLYITIGMLIHNCLWLLILFKVFKVSKTYNATIPVLVIISLLNIFLSEKIFSFNFMVFTIGALTYISFFIFLSFKKLKNEDLNFFNTNNFLLINSPILFFIGISFLLSFMSPVLTETKIIGDINLYSITINICNIIYYSLLNIYIFKERKKLKNAS